MRPFHSSVYPTEPSMAWIWGKERMVTPLVWAFEGGPVSGGFACGGSRLRLEVLHEYVRDFREMVVEGQQHESVLGGRGRDP